MPYGKILADEIEDSNGAVVDLVALTTGEATTSGYGYMSAADKTTLDVVIGGSDGKVALTSNDGYGGANVTFNHKSGVPVQDGSSRRIRFTTDASAGSLIFDIADNTTNGVAVTATEVFSIDSSGATFAGDVTISGGDLNGVNNITGTCNDLIIQPGECGVAKHVQIRGNNNTVSSNGGVIVGDENGGSVDFRMGVGGRYRFAAPGQTANRGELDFDDLTFDRTYTFPNRSGTVVLNSGSSLNTVILANKEKSDLTTDGEFGFDSSQGLLVYRTQQSASIAPGAYTVLDAANVVAGDHISITNLNNNPSKPARTSTPSILMTASTR